MRASTVLLLSLPGIVLAQTPAGTIKELTDQVNARRMEFYREFASAREKKVAPPKAEDFFAKDIQAYDARLKEEKDPDLLAALKIAMVTLRSGITMGPQMKGVEDLATISPLSPAWGVDPNILMVAAMKIQDPNARDAYLDQAASSSPVPAVQETLTFWKFMKAFDDNDQAGWKPALAKLESQFPGSESTKEALRAVRMANAVQVGAPAPAFDVPSLGAPQKRLTLDTYKGQYLLLDFWATWCGPCNAMLPTMEKLYGAYRGRGLRILSIADDKGDKVVQTFQKKPGHKMPWDNTVCVFDDKSHSRLNPISDDYGVRSLPTLFLIGPDGKVLAKGDELHEHRADVLARFIPAKKAH
jgi:thiol-disulfide isomerase/thioredoxin